jgi:hypothetical protein
MNEHSYILRSALIRTGLYHVMKLHTIPQREELMCKARQRLFRKTPVPLLS